MKTLPIHIDRRELKAVLVIWTVVAAAAVTALLLLQANSTRIVNHIEQLKAGPLERATILYDEAAIRVRRVMRKTHEANRESDNRLVLAPGDRDYAEAVKLYERAFAIDPRDPYSPEMRIHHEMLGSLHGAVGAESEQVKSLIRAFLCADDARNARVYALALKDKRSTDPATLALLAEAQLKLNDQVGADAAIMNLEAAGGDTRDVHELRARLALQRGNKEQAAAEYAAAIEAKPADVRLRKRLSELLAGLGKTELAANTLREGLAHGGKSDGNYLHRLGTVLLELNQNREAANFLLQAAAMAPGSADVQVELARAMKRVGNIEKANAAMMEAVRLNPALRDKLLE